PSKTDYYEFVHLDEGLSVSISHNSPPRALLEDEFIQPLQIYPPQPLVAKLGQILLKSGESDFVVEAESYKKEVVRIQRMLTQRREPEEVKTVAVATARQNEAPAVEEK